MAIEELIRSRQHEYYNALAKADTEADSSVFIEFILEVILDTLQQISVVGNATIGEKATESSCIQKLLNAIGNSELSAKEIMDILGLSHRASFRMHYLNPALERGLIIMTIPDKPNSKNQKYKKRT